MPKKDLDENRIIGEILIKQGLVSREQVMSALYVQNDKPHLRIGEILLSMGLITIEQLDRILHEHLSHQFIGSLLLSQGFIDQEQLATAMALQDKTNRRLGEILIEQGYITEFQLSRLLEKQRLLRKPMLTDVDGRQEGFKKKTKIIATLGPASSSHETIRAMIEQGVNLFRLNFSHGSHEDHKQNIERIRRVADQLGETVGILQDIQGPKIRIGEVEGGEVELKVGAQFRLVSKSLVATAAVASVSYERLGQDIPEGSTVLLDDGKVELRVTEAAEDGIITEVKVGGPLRPRKGVNFPGTTLGVSCVTDKDKEDLKFGAGQDVDWVAASFVQTPDDILDVKKYLADLGSKTPVIAKIETHEAVYRLQEIIAVADGVMVARGDLGVEFNSEDVPLIQKQIIRQANIAGRPVITATQMLDSMVNSPRPTRAEASDVANAILDGTDAVMLSNETAAGNFPVEAVSTMKRIIEKVEDTELWAGVPESHVHSQLSEAIAAAATRLSLEVNATAIVVPSYCGATARLVRKHKPRCLIVATSSDATVCRQMTLLWGVYPMQMEEAAEGALHPETIPRGTSSELNSTPRSPRATMTPSATAIISCSL